MCIFLYERLKTLMEVACGENVPQQCTLNSDGIISKACVDKAYTNVHGTTSVVIVNFIVHGEIIWLK